MKHVGITRAVYGILIATQGSAFPHATAQESG